MTGYRGRLEAFDKVSEHHVADQDVGPLSIDEVRHVFGCADDDPIVGAGFDVAPRHVEWIVSKSGCEFDFDRFDYQFSLRPET